MDDRQSPPTVFARRALSLALLVYGLYDLSLFEQHGRVLQGALEVGHGGMKLKRLGYDEDLRAAAKIDQFAIVPEVRRDPVRVEVGSIGIVKSHWPK